MSSKVVSGSKGKKHGIGECIHFAMKSNITTPKILRFVSGLIPVALFLFLDHTKTLPMKETITLESPE